MLQQFISAYGVPIWLRECMSCETISPKLEPFILAEFLQFISIAFSICFKRVIQRSNGCVPYYSTRNFFNGIITLQITCFSGCIRAVPERMSFACKAALRKNLWYDCILTHNIASILKLILTPRFTRCSTPPAPKPSFSVSGIPVISYLKQTETL